MSNETTDEGNTAGKEVDKGVTTPKKNISEFDKLKTSNDEMEKELIRGRELREENQKLAAEKMRGGTSIAGQEQAEPKEETPKEYRDRIDKEISEGKHND